jgi:hypothetical protein
MTQVHHEITGITIPVCMVATDQPALCIASFAKLTTRALKHAIYSNSCSLAGCPNTALCMATGLAVHIMVITIHTGIVQAQNLSFHNQIHNLVEKGIQAIYNAY